MYTKTRLIMIVALVACLCASCQQSSIPPKTTATPGSDPFVTTPPATSTPVSEVPATPRLDPDIEEYAVYNALLESKFAGSDISQILFIDQTDIDSKSLVDQNLGAFQESTPLDEELINNFMERNQQPYPLEPDLDFGLDYQLLTQEKVVELRSQDEASGWTLLYEKYPDAYGFVYLSRVGFNVDFSQALVYMSTYHYERLMEGGYYLMIRQDGRWVIKASYGFQS